MNAKAEVNYLAVSSSVYNEKVYKKIEVLGLDNKTMSLSIPETIQEEILKVALSLKRLQMVAIDFSMVVGKEFTKMTVESIKAI